MPAEAVHLSALDDTLVALPCGLRARLTAPCGYRAARLGAMFVDLPYFQASVTTLLGHALGLSPRSHAWGDLFHHRAPIALAHKLGAQGTKLRRSGMKAEGDYLTALALGYICHAAIDTALHPLVNRLAQCRSVTLSDHPLRQHREVEKYHSILFHQERHGHNYLGSPELHEFLALDVGPVWRPGPIADAVRTALLQGLGMAPEPTEFASWERGFNRYLWVLSGPLGRRAASAADMERERPALYAEVDFPERYQAAVHRSIEWVTALIGLLDAEADGAALQAAIPEQSLDPPYQDIEAR